MNYLGGGTVNNSHLLIALNRLWAVSWPISYRHFHRTRTVLRPVSICAAMWLYVNLDLMIVPGIIVDAYTPSDSIETFHCHLWSKVQSPLLTCSTSSCSMFQFSSASNHSSYTRRTSENEPKAQPQRVSIRATHRSLARVHGAANSRHRTQTISESQGPGNLPHVAVNEVPKMPESAKKTACCRDRRKANAHGSGNFLTLSLLILGVLVSLSPAQVFYTLTIFHVDVVEWFPIVWILYSFSPIFDPLLILFTVRNMHAALKNCCNCGTSAPK